MDLCTCMITLGGDSRQQVPVFPRNAKTYAEIVLLRFIHGGTDTVRNVQVIKTLENFDAAAEKQRLVDLYGRVAEQAYPGLRPAELPSDASSDPYPGTPLRLDEDDKGKTRSRKKPASPGDDFPD